ncbi:hypothetical protein [Catenulispora rubra]|uniref:hypothetical protein n=1 Tax=Catenulispora rubra TaxID=280293 RepID=UPI00189231E0|nr:hypothetical protein [Catenulispora rubra]
MEGQERCRDGERAPIGMGITIEVQEYDPQTKKIRTVKPAMHWYPGAPGQPLKGASSSSIRAEQ